MYGGYNPMLVFNDLRDAGHQQPVELHSQLSNPRLLWFLADPLTSPDPYNGAACTDGAAPTVAANGLGQQVDPSPILPNSPNSRPT